VAVVHAWCANGAVGHALKAVNHARALRLKLPASAYTELLACFALNDKVEQAERVLAELEASGTPPLEAHYNALLRGCCARGDLEAAEALLERLHNDVNNMELVARRGGALKPTARTYGLLLTAHSERGDVAAVRRLMERMRWHRVPPSTAVFNMQIVAFGRARRPDAAESVLREMAGSGSWDMDALGIAPNAISFAAAADAWASAGRPDRVRGLLNWSRNVGVPLDEVSYGTLIKAHARAGQPEAAAGVLVEARLAGVPLGVVQYTQAVSAWVAAGRTAELSELLTAMASRADGAPAPNAVTWSTALYGLTARGKVIAAAAVLRTALSWSAANRAAWAAAAPQARASWTRGFVDSGMGADAGERAWDAAVAMQASEAVNQPATADQMKAAAPSQQVQGSTRTAENARAHTAAVAARTALLVGEAAAAARSSPPLLRGIVRRGVAPQAALRCRAALRCVAVS
jgi:pentatricopeptide repeat protein